MIHYVSRIVLLNLHLDQVEQSNIYLAQVRILSWLEFQQTESEETVSDPKIASKNIKMKIKNDHLKSWNEKAQHGFLFKTLERISDIDPDSTNYWLTKSSTTSHVEGYIICAIQEEEINTRGLQKRRTRDEAA